MDCWVGWLRWKVGRPPEVIVEHEVHPHEAVHAQGEGIGHGALLLNGLGDLLGSRHRYRNLELLVIAHADGARLEVPLAEASVVVVHRAGEELHLQVHVVGVVEYKAFFQRELEGSEREAHSRGRLEREFRVARREEENDEHQHKQQH